MSKHTPKPWHYSEGCVTTIDNGDYIVIAEVRSTHGTDNFGVEPLMLGPEERHANGRLMAAAPEMYEALRHLAHNARASGAEMGLALVVAQDVLAKIEGGGK